MKFDKKELKKAVEANPELKAMLKMTKKKLPVGVKMANVLAGTDKKIDSEGYMSLYDYYGLNNDDK